MISAYFLLLFFMCTDALSMLYWMCVCVCVALFNGRHTLQSSRAASKQFLYCPLPPSGLCVLVLTTSLLPVCLSVCNASYCLYRNSLSLGICNSTQ